MKRGSWRRALIEGGLVMVFFALLAVGFTWPAAAHLDEVVLGGGELGGWLWRQWWHFQEVDALGQTDVGLLQQVLSLLGLGRYPETGNILDVLLLSYPLDRWLGFPAHHNVKVLLILWGNGLCGYAMARAFTDARLVSLAVGALAMANPLVFQDIDKTGLRQVLLWWLLLYPALLARAWRTARPLDGVWVGACFVAISAFYWFYGLFAVMFSVMALGWWWWQDRPPRVVLQRWMVPAAAVAVGGALIFVSPYLGSGPEGGGQGGAPNLPELSFFLPFPDYDTIATAPLRPSSYRENVLSSIHRTIESGWPADYLWNPGHGVRAFPLVVFLFGVLPALWVSRARSWFVFWLLFYLGTLGPFLKIGALRDTSEVLRVFDDFVVRLPYAWLFQWVPGMSRMFAPYRLASMAVVLAGVLVAITLDELPRLRRGILGALLLIGVVAQPFIRFDRGPVAEGSGGPSLLRTPVQVSAFVLPAWYKALDPEGWEGIIELPLDQQQDLLCAYQAFHQRKVYRSWASSPAIPPVLRSTGGGEPAKRLRWLAKAEPRKDALLDHLRPLSEDPLAADLSTLSDAELAEVLEAGNYRYVVVHERGYYLTNPKEGGPRYRQAVRLLTERLGVVPDEQVEQEAFDWPGKDVPAGPAWVPWASQEVPLPTQDMPSRYFMSVFDLEAWRQAQPSRATPL